MGAENRTTMELPMRAIPVDEVLQIMGMHLESSGFSVKLIDGEQAWSKGDTVITLMFCVKPIFTGQSVIIQGWTKDAILGEGKLEGFMGALPKRKVKKLLNRIAEEIQERDAALAANMPYGVAEQRNPYGDAASPPYNPNVGGYAGEPAAGYGWPTPGGGGYAGILTDGYGTSAPGDSYPPRTSDRGYGAPAPSYGSYAETPAYGYGTANDRYNAEAFAEASGTPRAGDGAYAGTPAAGQRIPASEDGYYPESFSEGHGAPLCYDGYYGDAPNSVQGTPMRSEAPYAQPSAVGYATSATPENSRMESPTHADLRRTEMPESLPDGRMEPDFVRNNEAAEAIKSPCDDIVSSRMRLSREENETAINERVVEEDRAPGNSSLERESAPMEEKRSPAREDIEHWDGRKALVFRKSRN